MDRKEDKNENEEMFCQYLGKKKYSSNAWLFCGYREYKGKLQTFCI